MKEQQLRDNARPAWPARGPAVPHDWGTAATPVPKFDFGQRDELNRVYRRLCELPTEIREAQQRVIEAEAKGNAWKAIDLPQAQEEYDAAVAVSSMQAMASGVIDGKNQAARDVQLANWLAEDGDVLSARGALTLAKRALADMETAAEAARADLARLVHEFHAVRAAARLQAADLEFAAATES